MSDANNEWQLQNAKARFSEVFERARTVGPQSVTRRGKEAVVVLSAEAFRDLQVRRRAPNLYELIADSPLRGANLDLERTDDEGRDVPVG